MLVYKKEEEEEKRLSTAGNEITGNTMPSLHTQKQEKLLLPLFVAEMFGFEKKKKKPAVTL